MGVCKYVHICANTGVIKYVRVCAHLKVIYDANLASCAYNGVNAKLFDRLAKTWFLSNDSCLPS